MNIAEVKQLVEFAQWLLETTTHEVLTDLEKILLKGILSDRTYPQISIDESIQASPEYLRRTVSPKLRQKLTDALKAVDVVDAKVKRIQKKEVEPKLRQAWQERDSGRFFQDGFNGFLNQGDGRGMETPSAESPQPPLARGAIDESPGFPRTTKNYDPGFPRTTKNYDPGFPLSKGDGRGIKEGGRRIEPIYQNLPIRDHTIFIGHEPQLKQLLKLLSWDSRIHRISIEGIGGAGKTTLILEAAYHCMESTDPPMFEAIIFTSAKPHRLTGTGILPRLKQENTLSEIFRTIARTLQYHDLLMPNFQGQEVGRPNPVEVGRPNSVGVGRPNSVGVGRPNPVGVGRPNSVGVGRPNPYLDEILDCLTHQRTLLIVDNLETAADIDDVRAFLYELPPTVKVAITSRKQALLDVPIHLECFSKQESLRLIQHHAKEKGVALADRDAEDIYVATGGIPAAIVYTIGQLSAGYLLREAIADLDRSDGEIARYCFQGSVIPLREKPPHFLLMALAIFPSPALPEAVCQVANVPNLDEFAPLQQLSLVKLHQGRYQMLPLTRGYVLTELKSYPHFQKLARNRWLEWSIDYCQKHGDTDHQEWSEYKELDQEWENLNEAIEWIVLKNRYEEFGQCWPYLKGYTHLAGYWNERLRWLDWWRKTAETQQDWLTVVEAIGDKSRTLTLLDQSEHHEEANQLLDHAWQLCQTYQLPIPLDLALNMAVLQVHQQNETAANQWFNQVIELQQKIPPDDPKHSRITIQILYYRGELQFKLENFPKAKECYEKALNLAQSINWQRSIIFLQVWLGLVAIELRQLQKAESLLEETFPLVKLNGDRRCLAFSKRAFAKLKKAQGDWQAAKHWAASAREDFRNLRMRREAAEMNDFLSVYTSS
jgi:tetratricopeptide (TPR) repeat protein